MKLKSLTKTAAYWASGRGRDLRKALDDSITIPESKRSYFYKTGPGEYAHGEQFLGITNPSIRRIAASFAKDMDMNKDILPLLSSCYNEERFLALVVMVKWYRRGDAHSKQSIFELYMNNLQYINNWNLVDTSAYDIVGAHLYGREDKSCLDELVASSVLWHRRIAIVSTFHFIRNGEVDWTFKLAAALMQDEEDLIHKAAGWMLREAGKKDRKALDAFVRDNAPLMPRTMLRYAIEKHTPEERKRFLAIKA